MTKLDAKPLVSIVIPYYQHKEYIHNCVETIIDQTYEKIELIIIDDCSPDGSGKYVAQLCQNEKWRKRFSDKISFIHFEINRGAHAAINHGIMQAQGEIISIVNSDDIYHHNRIKLMVEAMQQEQKQFAFSRVSYIDDKNRDVSQINGWALAYAGIQDSTKDFPTLGFACLRFNPAISTGNFVFYKSLYEQTIGFRSFRYCHDWDFILQCLFYTEPLFVQEKLYYYRLHETNTFKSLQKLGVDDGPDVLKQYFDSVRCQKTINPLAPSPFNWPGYFELFLSHYGLQEIYQKSVYVNT